MANQEVANIGIRLTLDASQFDSGIDKATEKLTNLQRQQKAAGSGAGMSRAGAGTSVASNPNASYVAGGNQSSSQRAMKARNLGPVEVDVKISQQSLDKIKRQVQEAVNDVTVNVTPNVKRSARAAAEEVVSAQITNTAGSRGAASNIVRSNVKQNLPQRMYGGPVEQGRSYLVGERGPEIVRIGQRGWVTPSLAQARAQERELARIQDRMARMAGGPVSGRHREMGGFVYAAGGARAKGSNITAAKQAAITRAYTANVRRAAAALGPEHIAAGKAWYPNAQAWIKSRADQYGLPEPTVRGLTAALSAATGWSSNKTKVDRILAARASGSPFPYSMGLNAHKKAFDILTGLLTPEQALMHTPKTGQFYLNTGGDLDALTIDRWAFRQASGGSLSKYGNGPNRVAAERAFKRVSGEIGMHPVDLQAALWIQWKQQDDHRKALAAWRTKGGKGREPSMNDVSKYMANGGVVKRRTPEMMDDELGLMRQCKGCGEWWPKDKEFFYFQNRDGRQNVLGNCRACWSELGMSKRKRGEGGPVNGTWLKGNFGIPTYGEPSQYNLNSDQWLRMWWQNRPATRIVGATHYGGGEPSEGIAHPAGRSTAEDKGKWPRASIGGHSEYQSIASSARRPKAGYTDEQMEAFGWQLGDSEKMLANALSQPGAMDSPYEAGLRALEAGVGDDDDDYGDDADPNNNGSTAWSQAQKILIDKGYHINAGGNVGWSWLTALDDGLKPLLGDKKKWGGPSTLSFKDAQAADVEYMVAAVEKLYASAAASIAPVAETIKQAQQHDDDARSAFNPEALTTTEGLASAYWKELEPFIRLKSHELYGKKGEELRNKRLSEGKEKLQDFSEIRPFLRKTWLAEYEAGHRPQFVSVMDAGTPKIARVYSWNNDKTVTHASWSEDLFPPITVPIANVLPATKSLIDMYEAKSMQYRDDGWYGQDVKRLISEARAAIGLGKEPSQRRKNKLGTDDQGRTIVVNDKGAETTISGMELSATDIRYRFAEARKRGMIEDIVNEFIAAQGDPRLLQAAHDRAGIREGYSRGPRMYADKLTNEEISAHLAETEHLLQIGIPKINVGADAYFASAAGQGQVSPTQQNNSRGKVSNATLSPEQWADIDATILEHSISPADFKKNPQQGRFFQGHQVDGTGRKIKVKTPNGNEVLLTRSEYNARWEKLHRDAVEPFVATTTPEPETPVVVEQPMERVARERQQLVDDGYNNAPWRRGTLIAGSRGRTARDFDYGNVPWLSQPQVKRHRAGGGPGGAGNPYIVGELGPELYVWGDAVRDIPKFVRDQIPRAAGGAQVIGKTKNELFFPPHDGVIVPNRFMHLFAKHAARGDDMMDYPIMRDAFANRGEVFPAPPDPRGPMYGPPSPRDQYLARFGAGGLFEETGVRPSGGPVIDPRGFQVRAIPDMPTPLADRGGRNLITPEEQELRKATLADTKAIIEHSRAIEQQGKFLLASGLPEFGGATGSSRMSYIDREARRIGEVFIESFVPAIQLGAPGPNYARQRQSGNAFATPTYIPTHFRATDPSMQSDALQRARQRRAERLEGADALGAQASPLSQEAQMLAQQNAAGTARLRELQRRRRGGVDPLVAETEAARDAERERAMGGGGPAGPGGPGNGPQGPNEWTRIFPGLEALSSETRLISNLREQFGEAPGANLVRQLAESPYLRGRVRLEERGAGLPEGDDLDTPIGLSRDARSVMSMARDAERQRGYRSGPNRSSDELLNRLRVQSAGLSGEMLARSPRVVAAALGSLGFGGNIQFKQREAEYRNAEGMYRLQGANVDRAQFDYDTAKRSVAMAEAMGMAEEDLAGLRDNATRRQETLTQAIEKHEEYAQKLIKAEKEFEPTTKNVIANFGSIIASTSAYGAAFGAANMVIQQAAIPALKRMTDSLLGFEPVTSRVTSALAKATIEQGNNYKAALAQQAVTAGMDKTTADWAGTLMQATVTAKSAATTYTNFSEIFKSSIGSMKGEVKGLFEGYGGIMGGPFFGEQLGGGKGLGEQVLNDLMSASGGPDFSRYATSTATGAGIGAIAGMPEGGPFGSVMGGVIGGAIGLGTTLAPDIMSGTVGEKGYTARNAGINEMLKYLNSAAERAGMRAGKPVSGGIDWREDNASARADAKKYGQELQAQGASSTIVKMAEMGAVFTDSLGNVTSNVEKINKYWADFVATGIPIPDPTVWVETVNRQVDAAFSALDMQDALNRGLVIPMQLAVGRIANPLLNAGTGVVPLGSTPAKTFSDVTGTMRIATDLKGGSVERSTAKTLQGWVNQANKGIDEIRKADMAAQQEMYKSIADVSGKGAADEWQGFMDTANAASSRLAKLQTTLASLGATAQKQQWANELRLAARAYQDAIGTKAGYFGKKGGSEFGQIQGQIQALSFALQQRQITTQVALAGFQSPGETGEERYMRQKQRLAEAAIAQRQFNLNKRGYEIGLDRGVTDTGAAASIANASVTAQRAQVAAAGQIAVEQAKIARALAEAGSKEQAALGKIQTGQQQIATFMSQFGGSVDAATKAFAGVPGPVGLASSVFMDMYKKLGYSFKYDKAGNVTSMRGPTDSQYSPVANRTRTDNDLPARKYNAAGYLGTVSGATNMIMGEAGKETVAILRNPRANMVGMGGGMAMGGGSSNITININGANVRNDGDIEAIAQRAAVEVEKILSRKGQLLGLRGPSY